MNDKQRRAAFALACAGMMVFGIVLTSLGTILPEIITRFGVTKTQAGSLFTLMSFGILAGSLVFGPWVDRSGYRLPLAASPALAQGDGVQFSIESPKAVQGLTLDIALAGKRPTAATAFDQGYRDFVGSVLGG